MVQALVGCLMSKVIIFYRMVTSSREDNYAYQLALYEKISFGNSIVEGWLDTLERTKQYTWW